MDAIVRQIQALLPTIIVSGVALYFAVVFLIGGARTLLQLYDGAPDPVAASLAQALGYAFGPAFAKVGAVAAAIGAAKLAVGGYFFLAVTERSPAIEHDEAQKDYGALDLALQGAVALTMFQAIPAWIGGDDAAVRAHTANIMLICVAIGTSMFERDAAARRTTRVGRFDEASLEENPAPPW